MTRNSFFRTALAAAIVLVSIAIGSAYSAVDIFLKIEGVEGAARGITKQVPVTGGSITVDNLPEGSYSMYFVDATGKKVVVDKAPLQIESWSFGASNAVSRDAASGQATGKSAATSPSTTITAPRDAASGLPTGKRMHKPFVITKELDKSSPVIFKIVVPEGGGSLSCKAFVLPHVLETSGR